jgi:anti-sigma B factor antagonist
LENQAGDRLLRGVETVADRVPFAVEVRFEEGRRGRKRGSMAVVAVTGEVDLSTVPELRRRLTEAISAPPSEVVVDLAGVDFIDASGVGVLLGAAGEAARAGVSFRVQSPSPLVERVLNLTRVDGALEVET